MKDCKPAVVSGTAESDGFQPSEATNGIEPGRWASVSQRLSEMPESCRRGYLAAAQGTASPRAAIKAFCLECAGWDRGVVTRCSGAACPLWPYRPFQDAR